MRLIASHTVPHRDGRRFVRLYQGDLAAIPADEAVDLLVVSAFPDDYAPTRTSLIGALHRRGVSVAALAADKEADLREMSGCWASRDLSATHPGVGFRRLLCFEPLRRGAPPEVVGDIFRAVVPFVLDDPPVRSMAMPVLAAGDQANDLEAMLRALFRAATQWLSHGLPLETVKIVVYGDDDASRAQVLFAALSEAHAREQPGTPRPAAPAAGAPYDFFVSYSHEDRAEVEILVRTLQALRPGTRVFVDRVEIVPGDAWQTRLDEALKDCRKVIAVYSPSYFRSKPCMEELNMARVRHRESGSVIIPLYLRSAELTLYTQTLHFVDCREADPERVVRACGGLVDALQAG